MIPTRQRFRALMAALAHFWPVVELANWVATLSVPDPTAVSWQALLWGLYAEPAELTGWAAVVGTWVRTGDGAVALWGQQACYRWEIVTTGETPWLGGAIAAWVTGEIPQDGLDFGTLQQAIEGGDHLYRRWAGLGNGDAPAVFYPGSAAMADGALGSLPLQ
ncbi:MAG: hypothetical protein ACUVSQ_08960 [Pseudanabaenaceae cyanobacterium]